MLNGRFSSALRRRLIWCAAGSAATALAVITINLAALPSSATAAAAPAIPAAAAAKLRSDILRLGELSGDRHPTSIAAVATTRAKALLDATPGDSIPARFGNHPVYLVVLTGNFTLNLAPTPPGGRVPTGNYLEVTIDPSTFRVLDLGLQHRPPPITLSRYGPVSHLVTQRQNS